MLNFYSNILVMETIALQTNKLSQMFWMYRKLNYLLLWKILKFLWWDFRLCKSFPIDGCLLAEKVNTGKIAATDFLKSSEQLRTGYESFKGTYKKRHHRRYHLINKVLCKWYIKDVQRKYLSWCSAFRRRSLKIFWGKTK